MDEFRELDILNAHFERQGRIMGVKKNDRGNIDLVCPKRADVRHNNGAVLLSYRDASKRLNVSYNSVGKWFRELEKRGFIVCMQRHHLGPSGVGQTSHWRLTEYEYEGRPPTADFKNWRPD